MTYLRTAAVALATIVGTILLGWWCTALVGGVAGGMMPRDRAAVLEAGGGTALGWAAILGWLALGRPVWTLAQRVGPVFGLPAAGFVAVALVFPAGLAGSAALVIGGVRRWSRIG